MELSQMPKIVDKRKKRVGRGWSSGRGKTAGRGTKGQKAREKVKAGFEGGQTPLIKRLPLARGWRNKPKSSKPIPVNLKFLNLLPKDSMVTLETLIKARIVDEAAAYKFGVKILGDGELRIPLKITLPVSVAAAKKIVAAGGKVEGVSKKVLKKERKKPEKVKKVKK